MSRRLFGTDGIRAHFGHEPLVEPTVRRIGAALGRALAARGAEPVVLLAGDTRASSPRLAAWVADGLTATGARPLDLGTLPTAAVARLVAARAAAAGVVLSASHNPAADNGIKLVGADGFKWSPADEAALERRIAAEPPRAGSPARRGARRGGARRVPFGAPLPAAGPAARGPARRARLRERRRLRAGAGAVRRARRRGRRPSRSPRWLATSTPAAARRT